MLKLLKMAKGMRALLDTVMQALPQVNVAPEGCRCLCSNINARASFERGRPLKDLCTLVNI